MTESGISMYTPAMNKKKEVLNQKAFEIGYAVFRVAGALKEGSSLVHYLENRVLDLVDTVLIGEYGRAKTSANSLVYMLHLGFEAGYISEGIFNIIKREIDNLVKEIGELPNAAKFPEIDPKSLFLNSKLSSLSDYIGETKKVVPEEEDVTPEELELEKISSIIAPKHVVSKEVSFNDEEDLIVPGMMKPAISGNAASKQSSSPGGSVPGGDRLSVILDTIKESGYCRLRDLQEVFPEFSERTIRYDIEKLANQGLIERVGNGGPSTFYRIKREVS